MKCQNCGKDEVNYHYTQVVNGNKKEIALCKECAKELGITMWDFQMPIDISNFLGGFFTDFPDNTLKDIVKIDELKCKNCSMTYEEFKKSGKFGCANCYEAFSNYVQPILKSLQGADTHVGRKPILVAKKEEKEKIVLKEEEEINKLKEELKKAIQEERYEDAAQIRDEISKKNKKD